MCALHALPLLSLPCECLSPCQFTSPPSSPARKQYHNPILQAGKPSELVFTGIIQRNPQTAHHGGCLSSQELDLKLEFIEPPKGGWLAKRDRGNGARVLPRPLWGGGGTQQTGRGGEPPRGSGDTLTERRGTAHPCVPCTSAGRLADADTMSLPNGSVPLLFSSGC